MFTTSFQRVRTCCFNNSKKATLWSSSVLRFDFSEVCFIKPASRKADYKLLIPGKLHRCYSLFYGQTALLKRKATLPIRARVKTPAKTYVIKVRLARSLPTGFANLNNQTCFCTSIWEPPNQCVALSTLSSFNGNIFDASMVLASEDSTFSIHLCQPDCASIFFRPFHYTGE